MGVPLLAPKSGVYWKMGTDDVIPKSSYMFTPTMPVPHGSVPRKARDAAPGCITTDTTTQPGHTPPASNRFLSSVAQGRVVGRTAS